MKGQYPIRVVSRLTGLGADTLRAWERRHRAVAPGRVKEHRLYTDADVARLRLMRDAVQAGHRIGRIARLGEADLRKLLLVDAGRVAAAPPATRGPMSRAALDQAIAALDTADIDRELSRLAAVLPPDELVADILLPALREAGERWHRRRGGIALEHILTSTLRSLLGSFLRIYARPSSETRLLFTTIEGDRHEIGILCAAMLAASSGLGVSYLGPDLPAAEVIDAVKASHARVLVLGLTFAAIEAEAAKDLRAIVGRLPAKVEVWAGGRMAARHASRLGRRAVVLADFEAYHTQLARIGGRIK